MHDDSSAHWQCQPGFGRGVRVHLWPAALNFRCVNEHLRSVATLGEVRLPDVTPVDDGVWFVGLAMMAAIVFGVIERRERAGPIAS